MTQSSRIVSLASLHKGARGIVAHVASDDAALGDESGATVALRLVELGFVAGEPLEIIAEARPGGDPIAVRIGGTNFALRRREAAAVMVIPEPDGASGSGATGVA